MDNLKFFLVMERRLGDYNLIDISKLDIRKGVVGNELSDIDSFTSMFTETEIRESISRSNMVHPEYSLGTLKVISDAKHNFPIITSAHISQIHELQINTTNIDQNLKNKIYGLYKKIIGSIFEDPDFIEGMLSNFKKILKSNDKLAMFKLIEELPYIKARSIYTCIINYQYDLKRAKMLRKTNDNL